MNRVAVVQRMRLDSKKKKKKLDPRVLYMDPNKPMDKEVREKVVIEDKEAWEMVEERTDAKDVWDFSNHWRWNRYKCQRGQ